MLHSAKKAKGAVTLAHIYCVSSTPRTSISALDLIRRSSNTRGSLVLHDLALWDVRGSRDFRAGLNQVNRSGSTARNAKRLNLRLTHGDAVGVPQNHNGMRGGRSRVDPNAVERKVFHVLGNESRFPGVGVRRLPVNDDILHCKIARLLDGHDRGRALIGSFRIV